MADSVIGALRVVLGLDSAKFEQGAKKAESRAAGLGKALGALAAAFATGALTAFVRSSMNVIDAQAKLAQSLQTTVGSIQVLERAGELAGVSMSGIEQLSKDLTRRLSQAAAAGGPVADALQRLGLNATDLIALPLDQRISTINQALTDFVPAAERAAVAGQLFGEEGSLLALRLDPATIRTATDDLERFGVIVSDIEADAIERANDAISRLGLIGRGVGNQLAVAFAPAIEAVANAIALIFEKTGPAGQAIAFLGDNIGRITAIFATFVAIVGVRMVAAWAVSTAGALTFAGALTVIRGALIRTGIGALVVAVGELVFQFTQLASALGGVGPAFSAIVGVAQEALGRVADGFGIIGSKASEIWSGIVQTISLAMVDAIDAVVEFANGAANTMEGAVAAIGEYWGALPGIVGEAAINATNAVIRSLDSLLGSAAAGINVFIKGLNAVKELAGGEAISLLPTDGIIGELENTFAGAAADAGAKARAAFDAAFSDDPFQAPQGLVRGLQEIGSEAVQAQIDARLAGDAYREAFTAPLESVQRIRDALRSAREEVNDPESFAGAEAALENLAAAADKAGAAGKGAADGIKEVKEEAEKSGGIGEQVISGLAGAFSSAIRGADSLKGALGRLADTLADQFLQLFFNQALGALFPGLGGFAGFGAIPGRAIGDSYTDAGVHLVGERGPELVNLPKGSKVFDANRTRSILDRGNEAPAQVSVTPRIINVLDPRLVGDFLGTPEGEATIVNVMQRNRGAMGA